MNEEQKRFIIENYPTMDVKEIAKTIGVKPIKVYKYASSKGIKKIIPSKSNKYTEEQKQFVLDNYSIMTNTEISNRINLDKKTIRNIAAMNNLKKNRGFEDNFNLSYEKRKYIMKFAGEKTSSEIGEDLGMPAYKVTKFCKRCNLNIKKNDGFTQSKNFTIEQMKFMSENYNTMKTSDIANKLNLTVEQVHSYCSNKGLVKDLNSRHNKSYYIEYLLKNRPSDYDVTNYLGNDTESKSDNLYKSVHGKYFINDRYFEIIDNEFKAYWLGFLYADGCVRVGNNGNKGINTLSIGLSSVDVGHIEKFKNSIQSDNPIKHKVDKNGFHSDVITITNLKICEDLIALGCTQKKSLTLEFPNENILPRELVRHFIRGYFDGDGCIHVDIGKRQAIVNFVGTESFLSSIQDIMCKELNITRTSMYKKKNNKSYQVAWGNIESVERIYKYLYKDCNIYLDRKLEKFDILYCLD